MRYSIAMRHLFSRFLGFLVIVASVIVLTSSVYAQTTPIKIGMSVALTGPSSQMGKRLYDSAKLYFDDVNKNGGINGQPLQLIAYDDHYDPQFALENTVKLINTHNVDLLFGYLGTPPLTRILPLLVLNSKKPVYLFFPLTGAKVHRISPYNTYVFNLRDSYSSETKALVDALYAKGFRRFAVFYQGDSYGRSGWQGIREALQTHGLDIVKEATYARGATFSDSFKKQVQIIGSGKPDVIMIVGTYAPSAGFIRDARDAGLKQVITNLSFVSTADLSSLLRSYSQKTGKKYFDHLIISQVFPHYNHPDLPAAKAYRGFSEKHHHELSYVGFEGFLDARLMVEILKDIQPPFSPEKLKQLLSSTRKYDVGLGTPIIFGGDDHQGLDTVFFSEIDNHGFAITLKEWPKQ